MSFVTANHDTEDTPNDLPTYLVLDETSLTMLEKKRTWWGKMEVRNLLQMPFLATSIFTWSDCRLCSSPKIIPAPQVAQWVSLIFETYCQLPNNLTSGTALLVEASVSQTKANHLRPQRTGYELLIATLDQWTRIAGKLLILFFFLQQRPLK